MSQSKKKADAGVFVSDLHMFSQRSLASRHVDAIKSSASRAKTFVLGGDIFDFRWSTLGSSKETVHQAVRWLDDLVSPHPNCDFHFVLGNHDTHAHFIAALDEFSQTKNNLEWHHYYVRLGQDLFMHGDATDRHGMDNEQIAARRRKYLHDEKRGKVSNLLYEAAVHAKLHRVTASIVHRKRRVARRLQDYLVRSGHGPGDGVRRVYFGHTHVPMVDYEFGGQLFNNGGAPIKGLDFRIVEF